MQIPSSVARGAAVAVLVVACLVPAGRAQQSPPAGGDGAQPTFRTGIDFVRVDVIVTDKGQPVTDLTQADFEVREDGQAQAIEQFRLIKVDNAARQAQAEAPQDRKSTRLNSSH